MELFGANLPTWVFLSAIVLIQLLWYFYRKFNYWRSQGVPFITRYPLIGSIDVWRKRIPFHEIENERYIKYGRLYGFYEGAVPLISCGEPEILKDILVKDFDAFPSSRDFSSGDPVTDKMVSFSRGDVWKRMRTIMTPAFTLRKLRIVCERMKECGKTLIENFRNALEKDSTVDFRGFLDCFAVDVMCSSMFGVRIDSYNDPNNEFLVRGRKLFLLDNNWKVILSFIFPKLAKYFGTSFFNSESMKYYVRVSEKIVQDRRESGKRQNDFLQILMDANANTLVQEEEDEKGNEDRDECVEVGQEEEVKKKVFQQDPKNKKLSNDEVLAQCVQFLLGSFDGVAGTISMICYFIALNPDCQEKLIAEIDKAVQANEEVDYTVIRDMEYLDAVVKETLRLFPPAFRTERQAVRDYRLGSTDIIVPKGGVVTIPIYGMHHDPVYFPDPEKFLPERFLPENKAYITPFTYLPFGGGPRNCLGMRLVMIEIKYCIIELLKNFRFGRSLETTVPPFFEYGQILTTPRSMKLKVEVRTDIPNKN